ncbi:hypothetical protein L5D93_19110 [Paenibacillus thiaminolyticus]|nr:hypothetical protein [Paenibacillus thiaminolyticus]
MPYEAKTDWKYDDLVTEKDMNRIEQGLKDAHIPAHQPLTLNPGLQVVEVENDTPFRMGEVKGRTLVNLLGHAGACDDVNLFGPFQANLSIEPTIKQSGTGSLKIASIMDGLAQGYTRNSINLSKGHYYLLRGWVYNESAPNISVFFGGTAQHAVTTAKGKWEFLYKSYAPTTDVSNVTAAVNVNATAANQAAYADELAIYEITNAEYDAIANMTPEQVAVHFPYVDTMTNVKNPYAIVTGGNLLPPFYEWVFLSGSPKIVDPYTLETSTTGDSYAEISVIPGITYTFSGKWTTGAVVNIFPMNPDGSHGTVFAGHTFKIPDGIDKIRVYFGVTQTGTYTLTKPMLVIGSEPKPFTPQQRSILAFEAELAANPYDGSNPDTLFMGDDGLPYVLEPWKRVVLDGGLEWRFAERFTGFKTVLAYGATVGAVAGSGMCTKYDGKKLGIAGNWVTDGPDNINGDIHLGSIYISVANTDSGWGPDYEPSREEIKAYFLGWKMYDNIHPDNPHNGAGKAWIKITCRGTDGRWSSAPPDARLTTPVDPAGIDSNGRVYTPYRLQYLKAKPTVEPVRKYEMGATLCAGSNMVEVGSGIVIREKVDPPENISVSTAGRREINYTAYPRSKLNYRTAIIIDIYRSNASDRQWTISNGTQSAPVINSYGLSRANIPGMYYDPNAVYYVTYTMLDPTLAASISGAVAANLRGTVSDLVQDVGDVQRRLSVVENRRADEVEDTGWIKVVPLNGWVHYSTNPLFFRVIDNRLLFKGIITDGTTAALTQLFNLPLLLPAGHGSWMSVLTWSGSGTGEVKSINCTLISGGGVKINAGVAEKYMSFDGIELLIDRMEVRKS